ncbi:MAG: class I SAM-dependent methyltransferase [Candidatus Heimdallarchaeota archaeon]|nr:MAG: class I SAM-dependent methyltransferase [Candidatus Heimdallarchaeota archaeon]
MKAWDDSWKTEEGRARWLYPDPFIVSYLPKLKKEGIEKVLDLGSGVGRHTILFAKEGFDVYGVDPSPSGFKYTLKWFERERLPPKLILSEMSQLPFIDDFFDLIVAWNVIYHGTAKVIHKTVNEIVRCLRHNGYLLYTLISTKHNKFGNGKEIEKNTYIIKEEKEKSHPHHYFNEEEINRFFKGFTHLRCVDKEQFYPGLFHWHLLSRLVAKH